MGRYISAILALLAVLTLQVSSACAGVVESGDGTYTADVVESETPVLLEFYATWCPACKKTAPAVEEMAKDFEGVVKVVRIDKDKNPNTAAMYGVQSIPMFYYIENGRTLTTVKGGYPKDKLISKLGLGTDGRRLPVQADKPYEASDGSYGDVVVGTELPVLLVFYDAGTEKTNKAFPAVSEAAAALAGRVKVVTMDRRVSRNTSVLFGVSEAPSYYYLVGGEIKGTATGVFTKDELVRTLGIAP